MRAIFSAAKFFAFVHHRWSFLEKKSTKNLVLFILVLFIAVLN